MPQLAKLQTKAIGPSPARPISNGDILKKYRVSTVTASETTSGVEDVVLADASGGAFTLTLKTPIVGGQEIIVKKTDATANAVTVATEGSEQIDDADTQVLSSQYDKIRVVSDDNDEWHILNT